MTDTSRLFIDKAIALLTDDYLPKIERCLAQLGDDDLWWRPNEASNSIGNLLLHLRGNVTQWIVGGVGRQEYSRNRQQEFDERGPTSSVRLFEALRGAVKNAEAVIRQQSAPSLTERRHIQGYDVTVL